VDPDAIQELFAVFGAGELAQWARKSLSVAHKSAAAKSKARRKNARKKY
jgi:hypothetical protein